MNSIAVTLAPDVLAEAVGIGDGQRAVAGLADRILPALQRQLALLRRERHGGALERLGDHRVDVLGGAERPLHQVLGALVGQRRA